MLEILNKRKKLIKGFKNRIGLSKKIKPNKEIKDVFFKCENCDVTIPIIDLEANYNVCPNCDHHFRIGAYQRIEQIFDEKSFKEVDKKYCSKNVNNFPDYEATLKRNQCKANLNEAVVCGIGTIENIKVATAVLDSNFMMGSMGVIVGDKITRIIELATKNKLPLVIFSASGGARMQEGIMSLIQMAKTSAALKRFDDEQLLYLSIITYPTTGGVSASFASLGDIIIAEPKALYGFAGKRVIQDTINEELPINFQSAEYVLECGFVDKIVHRKNLKNTLAAILKIHGGKNG